MNGGVEEELQPSLVMGLLMGCGVDLVTLMDRCRTRSVSPSILLSLSCSGSDGEVSLSEVGLCGITCV